jgi:hypothetical protein
MKKLVRKVVVPALTVVAQVAFAANSVGPQPPQSPPPILQPYPGPAGPLGPVDPTPVHPSVR